MGSKRRSNCPISFALDTFGDKWSLLVLRDIFFKGEKHYNEFLDGEEGISTNILAARLKQLERAGIIRKTSNKKNRKRHLYSPTDKGMDLIPLVLEMIHWSAKHDLKTGAPPEFVRRLQKDRKGLIREIRRQLGSI